MTTTKMTLSIEKTEEPDDQKKWLTKLIVFTAVLIIYGIASWLSNPPQEFNLGIVGDIALGIAVSVILTYLFVGIIRYQADSLPSVILAGGLLTILGMGIYGLLNNALEINLSTQRAKAGKENKYDVVSLNIGITKLQYTRARILDVKIDVYKRQAEDINFNLISKEGTLDTKYSKNLTSEINKLIKEFKYNENDELTNSKSEGGIVLVQGDKVSYSFPIVVEPSEIVRFDVAILCQQVILGIPIRWSRPQWTSSVVSFHSESDSESKTH